MEKRGQETFSISFSMIFSIIIIIAIVAVAVYAIKSFLDINKCAQVNLFSDELSSEVNKAWKSEIYHDIFPSKNSKIELPSSVESVCFGNLASLPTIQDHKDKQKEIKEQSPNENHNVFFYPPNKECISSFKLNHVIFYPDEFFCADTKDNKILLAIDIESDEDLVKIAKRSTS